MDTRSLITFLFIHLNISFNSDSRSILLNSSRNMNSFTPSAPLLPWPSTYIVFDAPANQQLSRAAERSCGKVTQFLLPRREDINWTLVDT